MRTMLCAAAAAAALLLAIPAALGLNLDSQGRVTDWAITPFSQANHSDGYAAGLWSTVSNDYSPISYPGVGHVPSPGGSLGEKCDLEEMYLRYGDQQTQVLLVASSPWQISFGDNTYHLGDLFLTVNGQKYGIVTQHATNGLTAGAIYQINAAKDTDTLEPGSGSWLYSSTPLANDYGPDATVGAIAGPWAVSDKVKSSQRLGTATLQSATFDYGGTENGTFLLEYNFDPALLGLDTSGDGVTAQITWGCGNDVIRLDAGGPPAIPEPGSFGLLAFGLASAYAARRTVGRGRSCPARIGG